MEEECDEQLTSSDYASDIYVEEDNEVVTSTSTPMQRLHAMLNEVVSKVWTLVRVACNVS